MNDTIYRPLEGRQTRPRVNVRCPQCGRWMVMRTNGATGEQFLGCVGFGYGACTATKKLSETMKLRLAGAAELPGMGEL